MSLHLRLLLGYTLILSLAFYLFILGAAKELKPGVRQATEQTLVNTAHLLAEVVAPEMASGAIGNGHFRQSTDAFNQHRFAARIWHLAYDDPDMRIYITDHRGIVLFDSSSEAVGEDYSRWNDVYLTLKGKYGVRSTQTDPADERTSVMHVAAPIKHQGKLIGVLTVSRPNLSLQPYVEFAQNKVRLLGIGLLLAALAFSIVISYWLTRSIRRLTRYADDIGSGKRVEAPRLAETELASLGKAMSSMRKELEGKEYVERYVHTLTHEIKSPLTAISAAVEILEEGPSPKERQRFLGNIGTEVSRMQNLVERLLNLATVEKRTEVRDVEDIPLADLIADALQGKEARLAERGLNWQGQIDPEQRLPGERFLLRQALSNLIDNAIDFSPQGGNISCRSERKNGQLSIMVDDEGPGIPEYALTKVTDRFYSLPRPDGGSKSTGLGLAFVREVAELHQGSFSLTNTGNGARATLRLPLDRFT